PPVLLADHLEVVPGAEVGDDALGQRWLAALAADAVVLEVGRPRVHQDPFLRRVGRGRPAEGGGRHAQTQRGGPGLFQHLTSVHGSSWCNDGRDRSPTRDSVGRWPRRGYERTCPSRPRHLRSVWHNKIVPSPRLTSDDDATTLALPDHPAL